MISRAVPLRNRESGNQGACTPTDIKRKKVVGTERTRGEGLGVGLGRRIHEVHLAMHSPSHGPILLDYQTPRRRVRVEPRRPTAQNTHPPSPTAFRASCRPAVQQTLHSFIVNHQPNTSHPRPHPYVSPPTTLSFHICTSPSQCNIPPPFRLPIRRPRAQTRLHFPNWTVKPHAVAVSRVVLRGGTRENGDAEPRVQGSPTDTFVTKTRLDLVPVQTGGPKAERKRSWEVEDAVSSLHFSCTASKLHSTPSYLIQFVQVRLRCIP